jgi:hypothetical protein
LRRTFQPLVSQTGGIQLSRRLFKLLLKPVNPSLLCSYMLNDVRRFTRQRP